MRVHTCAAKALGSWSWGSGVAVTPCTHRDHPWVAGPGPRRSDGSAGPVSGGLCRGDVVLGAVAGQRAHAALPQRSKARDRGPDGDVGAAQAPTPPNPAESTPGRLVWPLGIMPQLIVIFLGDGMGLWSEPNAGSR